MTELQILEKAIKQSGHEYPMKLSGVPFNHNTAMYSIIFSHGFARAFWGEDRTWLIDGKTMPSNLSVKEILELIKNEGLEYIREKYKLNITDIYERPAWQHHLQLMVLEENPIKYLEQFL